MAYVYGRAELLIGCATKGDDITSDRQTIGLLRLISGSCAASSEIQICCADDKADCVNVVFKNQRSLTLLGSFGILMNKPAVHGVINNLPCRYI